MITQYFTFGIPVDVAAAILGGIIGLVLVLVFEFITKPRIYPLSWNITKESFNLGFSKDPGENYKIRFRVRGLRSPGFCEVKIRWCGNSVKGKWDDAPNPLRDDDPDQFVAELVPQTYLNTVMLDEYYSVPVFNIDVRSKITVFDGWWFGKRLSLPYGPDPEVNKNTEIQIEIRGNELTWKKKMTIQQLIDSAK